MNRKERRKAAKQAADAAKRRMDAVRKFYEDATGRPHIGITIAGPKHLAVPTDVQDLAKRVVDMAQARTPAGANIKTMQGQTPNGLHFAVILFLDTSESFVYFTDDIEDAGRVNEFNKKIMSEQ